jgi:hypothetical protein
MKQDTIPFLLTIHGYEVRPWDRKASVHLTSPWPLGRREDAGVVAPEKDQRKSGGNTKPGEKRICLLGNGGQWLGVLGHKQKSATVCQIYRMGVCSGGLIEAKYDIFIPTIRQCLPFDELELVAS